MKKFLACALLAIGLTLNVNAQVETPPAGGPGVKVPSVPDNGTTAVLLGLSAVALVAFHRRTKAAPKI